MNKKVILKPAAIRSIINIGLYLSEQGYPITGERFVDELYELITSFGFFPEKFPICRNSVLAQHGHRCIRFKDWVIIYHVYPGKVSVIQVIHGSRIK